MFTNGDEKFNFLYFSLRSTIERAFGVLKKKFKILRILQPYLSPQMKLCTAIVATIMATYFRNEYGCSMHNILNFFFSTPNARLIVLRKLEWRKLNFSSPLGERWASTKIWEMITVSLIRINISFDKRKPRVNQVVLPIRGVWEVQVTHYQGPCKHASVVCCPLPTDPRWTACPNNIRPRLPLLGSPFSQCIWLCRK